MLLTVVTVPATRASGLMHLIPGSLYPLPASPHFSHPEIFFTWDFRGRERTVKLGPQKWGRAHCGEMAQPRSSWPGGRQLCLSSDFPLRAVVCLPEAMGPLRQVPIPMHPRGPGGPPGCSWEPGVLVALLSCHAWKHRVNGADSPGAPLYLRGVTWPAQRALERPHAPFRL